MEGNNCAVLCVQIYREEGINFDSVVFVDNQPVLDVIELKKTGIFGVLDEQCRMPRTNDETFLEAVANKQKKNGEYFRRDRKRRTFFLVAHYAGDVAYDVCRLSLTDDSIQQLPPHK